MTLTIHHANELRSIRSAPFRRPHGVSRIAVGITEVSSSTKRGWETELNRYSFACGCHVGAVFVVGALVVFSGHLILTDAWAWTAAPKGLAVLVAAALVGKSLALSWAHIRLRMTIAAISRHCTGTS